MPKAVIACPYKSLFLLPASERARKSSVFTRAYTARRSVSSGCLTLYILHRFVPKRLRTEKNGPAENKPARLLVGFSIAKKVLKSACRRNRCKRRVREAYKAVKTELLSGDELTDGFKHWYAAIFVIGAEAQELPYSDLKRVMRECLVKANKKFGKPNL